VTSPPLAAFSEAARTVDQARVLRLAWRCWWFGILGLIPVLGIGLAIQSARLFAQAHLELGLPWIRPKLWPLWLASIFLGVAHIIAAGLPGAFLIYALTLAAQSRSLFQSFPSWQTAPSQLGRNHLRAGLILGYTGRFTSLFAFFVSPFSLIPPPA
jgi:hypothetical protein